MNEGQVCAAGMSRLGMLGTCPGTNMSARLRRHYLVERRRNELEGIAIAPDCWGETCMKIRARRARAMASKAGEMRHERN